MDNLIEGHLDALRKSRYSKATLTERRRVLETLPSPIGMNRLEVKTWWDSRQIRPDGTPRAAPSLTAESSHVREFWRWCRQEGHIDDHNPADWLPRIRQQQRLASPVSEGELFRVIRDAASPMRQMIALGAMAGLRSAEIASVTWEDIDRDNGVLRIRDGKGGRDRTVPLSAGLLGELGEPGTGPIVGKKMTAKAVSAAIGRHMRAKGVDLTAHKLRARAATRFLAVTGDAVATAKMLGHADLTNVMRYAVASDDTMRRGAEATGRIG